MNFKHRTFSYVVPYCRNQKQNIQLGKKSDSRQIRSTGSILVSTAAKHVMKYCLK